MSSGRPCSTGRESAPEANGDGGNRIANFVNFRAADGVNGSRDFRDIYPPAAAFAAKEKDAYTPSPSSPLARFCFGWRKRRAKWASTARRMRRRSGAGLRRLDGGVGRIGEIADSNRIEDVGAPSARRTRQSGAIPWNRAGPASR
jgi:hypothetical protein